VTVLLAAGIPRLGFDYDITEMLPRNAESVRVAKRVFAESDFSVEFNALVADSLAEVRARAKALAAKPSIARVESAARFIPEDQDAKLEILRKLAPVLEGATTRYGTLAPVDGAAMRASLQRLAGAAEDAAFLADTAGRAPLAGRLRDLAAAARATAVRLEAPAAPAPLPPGTPLAPPPGSGPAPAPGTGPAPAPGPTTDGRLAAFQARLFSDLADHLALFHSSLAHGVISAADIPPGLRSRFIGAPHGPDGHERYALYAYPSGSIWRRDVLTRFVTDTKSVDPGATGYPINFLHFSGIIVEGFRNAAIFAALVMLIVMLADLRRLRDALLGMIPLLLGVTWMIGVMGWARIDYNLANVVALPLILGIGVDNGVHVLHRLREEKTVLGAVRGVGGSILLSALTNMAGFASLMAASHRGIASMGLLLVLGLGCCLTVALFVLPAVLQLVTPAAAVAPAPEPGPPAAEPRS